MGSWIEVAKWSTIGALIVGILPWFLNHPARGSRWALELDGRLSPEHT